MSLRGIDNALYYHLRPDDPALYENWTGCGNCLNLAEPRVVQLVMDSLRHWVTQLGVDGFRFDLAPILGRRKGGEFDPRAPFFAAVAQDPVLARALFIAEPWDVGPGGYRLGEFPPGWLEWNDRFRDTQRGFWLHQSAGIGEFARRFTASSDAFQHDGRAPTASVNFVTAHDGFTLRDLLSYNERHNLANGENNRDGHSHNLSRNCGVEGDTGDPTVLAERRRLQRVLLAALLLSQGTPMLLAGDELGRTQHGNNNAYCQDNDTTWLDWNHADANLGAYVARLLALRREAEPLRHAQVVALRAPTRRHGAVLARPGGPRDDDAGLGAHRPACAGDPLPSPGAWRALAGHGECRDARSRVQAAAGILVSQAGQRSGHGRRAHPVARKLREIASGQPLDRKNLGANRPPGC